MHLLSVSLKNKFSPIALVMAEASQKTTQKVYVAKALKMIDLNTIHLENEIIEFYHNDQYIEKKRVFSQDRRPAKNVKALPRIIINTNHLGFEAVSRLRQMNIPVETILVTRKNEYSQNDLSPESLQDLSYKSVLGDHHVVSDTDILSCVQNVFHKKRIHFDPAVPINIELKDEIEHLFIHPGINLTFDLVSEKLWAFFLLIWFRETIRYKKIIASGFKISRTQI